MFGLSLPPAPLTHTPQPPPRIPPSPFPIPSLPTRRQGGYYIYFNFLAVLAQVRLALPAARP